MRLRGGAPPDALPGAIYHAPLIWREHPARRACLYLVAIAALVTTPLEAREAIRDWDRHAPLSDVISLRHVARDKLLGAAFNFFIAWNLIAFDRRRVRIERGLRKCTTANDWYADPLFTPKGRICWHASFWHCIANVYAWAAFMSAATGFYDAVEAAILPPADLDFGWSNTWAGTLAGALIAAAVGSLLVVYNHRRLRREARSVTGACVRCGYDLRASPRRCPECGSVAPRGLSA